MACPDNKRILRTRSSGVLIYCQLLSGRWALARRKSASRYLAFGKWLYGYNCLESSGAHWQLDTMYCPIRICILFAFLSVQVGTSSARQLYFPLDVGNLWTIVAPGSVDENFDPGDALSWTVEREIIVNDTAYVVLSDSFLWFTLDTLRVDQTGNVWARSRGVDRLLLDFSAEEGSSYTFVDPQAPDGHENQVKVTKGLSVEVYAGQFEDAVSFTFDDPGARDDRFEVTFAKDIGVVQMDREWGFDWELYSANIGGVVVMAAESPSELLSRMPVQIFPVPASSSITVELSDALIGILDIQVFDLTGKRVLQTAKECSFIWCTINLEVSGLSSGQYFLRITSDGSFQAVDSFLKQ